MKRYIIFLTIIASVLVIFLYSGYAYDLPKWFSFNRKNALQEWQEKIFKDRVIYEVQPQQNAGYLSARSEGACSGLIYKIKFDAVSDPMISWEWKVTQFPDKSRTSQQEGGWLEKDDYAARVYVIFPSWNFMNIKTIEYVWDESLPIETIMTSPFSDNIKIIVIETGRKNFNQWIFEKRNIYRDYLATFGKARALRVGAIALMTDADNTVSTAEAFYKNIKVGYRE